MELVNTGRRVQNPLQHKGFRRFQSCRHRPQQTRKCQVRTRLEISCTSRYRGFESHSLRHQEPVIKPITGSFLFPKRAIPCSFTFSERKSSVLPNINRSPPAFEVAALRQNKPCLHRLCRGDLGFVIQVGVDIRRGGKVAMSQPLLNVLEGDAIGQQQTGAAVPLRYNNDKQKKPLFSRGLSVCRLLFNSFSKLKIDENYKEKRRLFY